MTRTRRSIIGILLPVFTFGNFLGLLITPALPGITRDFNVNASLGAQVMSFFLFGYAFGQLPYGPLAKRFGRKGALTIGSVLALIGSLLAWVAPSFSVLCIARILQAVGSGVGLKITVTMIADLYSGATAARVMATLSMAFGAVPAFATALGGFITLWFGWRVCFLFLALYSIVLWACTRLLPETAPQLDKQALRFKKILSGYAEQFRDPYLVLHGVFSGLTAASMYIFATLAPYIGMETIGLRPDTYGLLAMIPSFGLMVGAWIARYLSARDARLVMLSGVLMFILSTVVLALCFINGAISVWTLFIPAIFLYIGNTWIWSRAFTHGLTGVQDKSNGAAVMQFINVGMAAAATFCIELFSPTNIFLMPAALGIVAVMLLITWLALKARHPAS